MKWAGHGNGGWRAPKENKGEAPRHGYGERFPPLVGSRLVGMPPPAQSLLLAHGLAVTHPPVTMPGECEGGLVSLALAIVQLPKRSRERTLKEGMIVNPSFDAFGTLFERYSQNVETFARAFTDQRKASRSVSDVA